MERSSTGGLVRSQRKTGSSGREKAEVLPRGARRMREKEVQSMLSRYRGRGFYDPLSEMNRLFEQMFGGTTRRPEKSEEERGGYLVRERRYGSFRRSLQLPEDVDESKINARFENGVLEVRIQGAAAAREPKRVQIESQEETLVETGSQKKK